MHSQLPSCLNDIVRDLLDLKMNVPEVKHIPRIDVLNDYIERSLVEIREQVEQYPKEVLKDWDELNALFLSALEV